MLIQSKGHIINTRGHQCSTQCCISIVETPLERKLCSDKWWAFDTTMHVHKWEELQSYLTNILINFEEPFRIIQNHSDILHKFTLTVQQLNNFLFRGNDWWRSWGQGRHKETLMKTITCYQWLIQLLFSSTIEKSKWTINQSKFILGLKMDFFHFMWWVISQIEQK